MDISNKVIGVIGVGKIGSCVCKGYASYEVGSPCRPSKIIVSPRSKDKAEALKDEYPDLIEIATSNEEVIANSDIIYIGLLPKVAKEIIPLYTFNSKHFIISMMATIDYDDIVSLTKVDKSNIVRIVPLPSCSQRSGPITMFPDNAVAASILQAIGTVVKCDTESEMKPMVSMAGHISSFYELMRVTQDWCIKEGVSPETARLYTSSFYSSLAKATEISHESLHEMCVEAMTPGGINEQAMKYLSTTNHYIDQEQSLTAILNRLKGL